MEHPSHYPYGSNPKWHSAYKRLCRQRTFDELVNVIATAIKIIAIPDNPKASQYWDEIHYCREELKRRQNPDGTISVKYVIAGR